MSAANPIKMTYTQYGFYMIRRSRAYSRVKGNMEDPPRLTAKEIIRDPARINGRRLPNFKVHLSLHIPTHG